MIDGAQKTQIWASWLCMCCVLCKERHAEGLWIGIFWTAACALFSKPPRCLFGHETWRQQVTMQSKATATGDIFAGTLPSVCARLRWYRDACPAAKVLSTMTMGFSDGQHQVNKTVAQTFNHQPAHDKRGATIENSGSVAEKRLPFAENPFVACTMCWIFSMTIIPWHFDGLTVCIGRTSQVPRAH